AMAKKRAAGSHCHHVAPRSCQLPDCHSRTGSGRTRSLRVSNGCVFALATSVCPRKTMFSYAATTLMTTSRIAVVRGRLASAAAVDAILSVIELFAPHAFD